MANQRTLKGRQRTIQRNLARARARNEQFASTLTDPKSRFRSTSNATTSKSSISNYMSRPYDNTENIAANLRDAAITDGIVSSTLRYYQSHPTYNYSLFPVLGHKVYDVDQNMKNDYIDAAYLLNQYNIYFWAPYFFKETLLDGVTYWYTITDSSGVSYLKFPLEWCRVASIENGVYRFRIDMSKIKDEVQEELPTEIQKAYKKYKDGSISDDDQGWYDRKWYIVSDKGVAFTFDQNILVNGGTTISPFAAALMDSVSLSQAKDNVDIKDKLDTIRIIHSKIPTNSEGVPTLNLKTAKLFDAQMRSRLPEGVVPVTSPSNLTNVPLKGAGNDGVFETVGKQTEQLFYSLGTSAPLFGGSTTSANIVKESVRKDANWIFTNLFPMLENYYNQQLTSVKTKSKVVWNMRFIRESRFTLKDDIASYKDQLSYGGSRLDYLAACGLTPIESISKLLFEQKALDIDSIMKVKPTSNTLSAKSAKQPSTVINPNKGQPGRPKTDNPTDDTDRLDGEE
ncbi:hypothetical protein [Limosilactobacillus reuteri]|uniref:Phage portal protein n=1 Tax=Limosilactobacillus reuteri TaxID=1598 RepID=A0ABD6Y7Y1_LIMRT|nr:hypothetical protein [Limosilactobacillus reuteri]PWT37677.1 hypothetical protein DKZ35_04145 [Limosilactobacillus reuteri]